MNTESKLAQLRKKSEKKAKELADCGEVIAKTKAAIKALKKELSRINSEISALELMQLSETLNSNGITAADITAAIAAGNIKKAVPEQESVQQTTDKTEVKPDEISGSGKAVGNA